MRFDRAAVRFGFRGKGKGTRSTSGVSRPRPPAPVERLEPRWLLSAGAPAVVATAAKTIDAVAGHNTGSIVVATFTDPAGPHPIGTYSATVIWGDGTAPYNGATIVKTGTNSYKVVAKHTYALAVGPDTTSAQPYTVTVTVHKVGAPNTPSTFKFITLDPAGIVGSSPGGNYGINDFRDVTGLVENDAFQSTGVLFKNGVPGAQKLITIPGGSDTETYQINNRGQIAVSFYGAATVYHAAVYDKVHHTFTILPDVPGFRENLAGGITDGGLVVGDAFTSAGFAGGVGWTYQNGKYSLFTAPGNNAANGGTATYSVNNEGQIVGYVFDAKGVQHGYLKTGPAFTMIDYPGAAGTVAYGVNNEDVVAGSYRVGKVQHGYLWYQGAFETVDVPGAAGTYITAINDQGDIAGIYVDKSGNFHGFEALNVQAAVSNTAVTTANVGGGAG